MITHYADNKFEPHELPEVHQGLKIAFIGNSLTLHAPSVEIGWHLHHGMAASATGRDYAHRLMRQLRIEPQQAYIRNFYPFESDASVAGGHLRSLHGVLLQQPAVLVIQLGDNVSTQAQLDDFAHNLQLLVYAATRFSPNVLCVSTWWQMPATDSVIEQVCQLHNAQYVYIGDLFDSPHNIDRIYPTYAHSGVEAHPKDWGMEQISERLYRAILGRLPGMTPARPLLP
ncbi:SGNH/GDSL hydrolase family protein [Rugamonas sp. A1-17]|nr:SGNH/GDSL hydrolase family protein [Rugamonas sp. A1-17]